MPPHLGHSPTLPIDFVHPASCPPVRPGTAAAGLCFSQAEAAALLRKEQLNSYGVLATRRQAAAAGAGAGSGAAGRGAGCREGSGAGCSQPVSGGGGGEEDAQDGERHLRGSAIYAQAALINHECLPNVARYDSFDAPAPAPSPSLPCQGGSTASGSGGTAGAGGCRSSGGSSAGGSTHVVFRALHDLPPGTEVTTSYVPLHWGLRERQAQCREVYGFACTCPRCQVSGGLGRTRGVGRAGAWSGRTFL